MAQLSGLSTQYVYKHIKDVELVLESFGIKIPVPEEKIIVEPEETDIEKVYGIKDISKIEKAINNFHNIDDSQSETAREIIRMI